MISGMVSFSFRHMQLRLSFTAFISCRISLLEKMSRGIKSSPGGKFSIIQNHNVGVDRHVSRVAKAGKSSSREFTDGTKKQTECSFDPANDDEFPSLSASAYVSSKRRTRTEIRTQSEQKSEQGVEQASLSQPSAPLKSNSAGQPSESPSLSDFQKKNLPSHSNRPLSRISAEQVEGLNKSRKTKFKPYDIYAAESSKQVSPQPSLPACSSQLDASYFSSGFQKKHLSSSSDRPHFSRISPEQGVDSKNSRDTKRKPFNICFSDRRKQVVWKPSFQIKEHCIQMGSSVMENGEVLRTGMVLLKSYIPLIQQVNIILRCQELGRGSGGFYQPGYQDGSKLRLHMMCLGLDWDPQTRKYGRRRQHDNSKPPDIPLDFGMLVKGALHDSHALIKQQLGRSDVEEILPSMSPDICIVNFYTSSGRLGLHKDRDESRVSLLRGLPVVSFSIGDSAEFLYGDDRDIEKADSVILESGDVLIFGGDSRHIFHGVTTIFPKTAPRELLQHAKLRPGRLNLTFRKY